MKGKNPGEGNLSLWGVRAGLVCVCSSAAPPVLPSGVLIAAFSSSQGGCGGEPQSALALYSFSVASRRLQTLELVWCRANSLPGTAPRRPLRALLLRLPAAWDTESTSLWDKGTAAWSGDSGRGGSHPSPPSHHLLMVSCVAIEHETTRAHTPLLLR